MDTSLHYADWQRDEMIEAVKFASGVAFDLGRCVDSLDHHADDKAYEARVIDAADTLAMHVGDIDYGHDESSWDHLYDTLSDIRMRQALLNARSYIVSCVNCWELHMHENPFPDFYLLKEEREERGLRLW